MVRKGETKIKTVGGDGTIVKKNIYLISLRFRKKIATAETLKGYLLRQGFYLCAKGIHHDGRRREIFFFGCCGFENLALFL